MTTPPAPPVHICFGGPTFRIRIDDNEYFFEKHSFLGPLPVKKNGDGRHLSHRHKFWKAVTAWYQQGCHVDEDGLCRWEPEPQEDLSERVRVGKHLMPKAMAERVTKQVEERRQRRRR